ncbi:hypothetical protein [Herpetosiphon geysericola]|uniref:Uncharacterized protein n=1 Tax=Herpetosiphon geysericola TaxID=70996 RepID=A0A0P6XUI7_9CHLR|nr:hypothetical protein [Herpetosiphon geysericola]KPL80225.1 hypothetical protein SE18_24530 [Herpetosiphon geysericola]
MSIVQLAGVLALVVVIVVAVALVNAFAPKAAEAFKGWADAHLGAEQREAIYGAVKAGLRAAEQHGFRADELFAKAAKVASEYLKTYGLPISEELLSELVRAEKQKKLTE